MTGTHRGHPPGWVLCPHCGLYVDPTWGRCAHDPATPAWMVKARLRSLPGPASCGRQP